MIPLKPSNDALRRANAIVPIWPTTADTVVAARHTMKGHHKGLAYVSLQPRDQRWSGLSRYLDCELSASARCGVRWVGDKLAFEGTLVLFSPHSSSWVLSCHTRLDAYHFRSIPLPSVILFLTLRATNTYQSVITSQSKITCSFCKRVYKVTSSLL